MLFHAIRHVHIYNIPLWLAAVAIAAAAAAAAAVAAAVLNWPIFVHLVIVIAVTMIVWFEF